MQYVNTCPALNVEESDRLSFMPYLFGTDFMLAELQVYALAKKWMPGYEGGFWHFIRLPEGGSYMMPDSGRVHLVSGENWFDRMVCADAAGIILTSLAINRRLAAHPDSSNPALTRLYMLRDAQL
ncbi:antirestriction protein, partial [Klebsiella variicola]